MATLNGERQKKGAKTEAILRLLEARGVSQPSAIGPLTGLSAKEVSSRISMLVSQGRVARERGTDGVQRVRFVSWTIHHSRVVEPTPLPEVPYLQHLWGPPGAAQLIALADAVAEDARISASLHAATAAAPATPFVQVLLRAKTEGRVRVYTHCFADLDDDESEAGFSSRAERMAQRMAPAVAAPVVAAPVETLPVMPGAVVAKAARKRNSAEAVPFQPSLF